MIGIILLLAGLFGCAIALFVSYSYQSLNGDKYGAAKDTRKQLLALFGTPAAIGAAILLVQYIL